MSGPTHFECAKGHHLKDTVDEDGPWWYHLTGLTRSELDDCDDYSWMETDSELLPLAVEVYDDDE